MLNLSLRPRYAQSTTDGSTTAVGVGILIDVGKIFVIKRETMICLFFLNFHKHNFQIFTDYEMNKLIHQLQHSSELITSEL